VLFSIIIPTHNRLKSLIDALESVFQQTVEDYEVIVVDDGSTDGTAEKMLEAFGNWKLETGSLKKNERGDFSGNSKSYIQNPTFKILLQKNAGPGAARNLGAREARGEYLAFLDSDDLWFPYTLETYLEVIEKENRPGFVAGCPFVFEEKEQVDAVAKENLQTKRFADYLESGDERRWWGVSSFVVKKSLFEQLGGFASEFVNGEDADFVMKCGTEPGFVQVVCPFTFGYRKHEANITNAFDKNLAGAHLQIRNEKSGIYPGGKSRSWERWHILSRQIRPVAVAALENRRPDAAWELYKATFGWHLALGKWKFLLGMPLAIIAKKIGRQK
jgi:glycosyltransferase involved in cell wall biosynthesis